MDSARGADTPRDLPSWRLGQAVAVAPGGRAALCRLPEGSDHHPAAHWGSWPAFQCIPGTFPRTGRPLGPWSAARSGGHRVST